MPPVSSSNWAKLSAQLKASSSPSSTSSTTAGKNKSSTTTTTTGLKHKRIVLTPQLAEPEPSAEVAAMKKGRKKKKKPELNEILAETSKLPFYIKKKYVALDCEMVGIGETGEQSALARCAVVDFDGAILYDQFVRPPAFVTDFRTQFSGIRKQDLRRDKAITLKQCQEDVARLLKDKVLVGHALHNDMSVLLLTHPRWQTRDTATFNTLMRKTKFGKFKPRKLKELIQQHLGYEIQAGEHDPGVDARGAMFLYRKFREEWETMLTNRTKAAKERLKGNNNNNNNNNKEEEIGEEGEDEEEDNEDDEEEEDNDDNDNDDSNDDDDNHDNNNDDEEEEEEEEGDNSKDSKKRSMEQQQQQQQQQQQKRKGSTSMFATEKVDEFGQPLKSVFAIGKNNNNNNNNNKKKRRV